MRRGYAQLHIYSVYYQLAHLNPMRPKLIRRFTTKDSVRQEVCTVQVCAPNWAIGEHPSVSRKTNIHLNNKHLTPAVVRVCWPRREKTKICHAWCASCAPFVWQRSATCDAWMCVNGNDGRLKRLRDFRRRSFFLFASLAHYFYLQFVHAKCLAAPTRRSRAVARRWCACK